MPTPWPPGWRRPKGSSVSVEEIYREVILDHYRKPRHQGHLDAPDVKAEGNNPLCGDEITVELRFQGDTVADAAIEGQGCSISQASASMMAETIVGKTVEEIETVIDRFKAMMDIEHREDEVVDPARPGAVLGDLEALQGVRKFPVRIKCADLAWTTLQEALASR